MHFPDLLKKGITFVPDGPALTPQDIAHWETIVASPFPDQYRDYLLHANGGGVRLAPTDRLARNRCAFNIAWPSHWPDDLRQSLTPDSVLGDLFALQDVPVGDECFTLTFDYNYNSWKHVLDPDLFPIARDPFGNLVLIGLQGERKGKILFWQRVNVNPLDNPDVASYAYTGWVADSFVEFILSLTYDDY